MNTDVPVSPRTPERQEVFWAWVDRKVESFTIEVLQQVLLSEQQEQVGAPWN